MATYIPKSYTEASAGVAQMSDLVTGYRREADGYLARMAEVATRLDDMGNAAPVGWADLVSYVDAQVVANPADLVWLRLKEQIGKTVGDFQAERDRVNAMVAAAQSV